MKTFPVKIYYSNCLIEVLKLKLRFGNRVKIEKVRGHFHFYCRSTKSDLRIHFSALLPKGKTIFWYLCHKGYMRVSW